MNSYQFIKVFLFRQSVRLERLSFLLKNRQWQISALANSADLNNVVTFSTKTPIEGSRFQIGENIIEYLSDGKSRCFKIIGIQSSEFFNVYTVIDLNSMKSYFLKENRATPGDEITKDQNLQFEVEISANLGSHPHLVKTDSIFNFKNRVYLLTEHIDGNSLDRILKENKLELKTALIYSLHICYAMTYAKKIFPDFRHGDIKPGNCLITYDNKLKLGDFGQSIISKRDEVEGKLPAGTYYYMSPEMFDSSNSDRDSSDIYAFGVTCFEMFTGVCPFNGSTRKEIADKHINEPIPIKILRENAIPESIIKIISFCLEKNPSKRPQSFQEIEKELKKIYRKELKQTAPKVEIIKPTLENLIHQSVLFYSLGKYEKALSLINKALRQDKSSTEAFSQKALILSQLNQEEKALKLSLEAISQKKDSFPVLFIHAKILYKSQHLNKALETIEKALKIEPNNVLALILRGEIFHQKRQTYSALKDFEKAMIFDFSQSRASEKLAEMYFSEGLFEKALKIAEKGLVIHSHNINLLRVSADIYFLQGQRLKAIEFYKKVLTISSDYEEINDSFIRNSFELFKTEKKENNIEFIELLTIASDLFYKSNNPELSVYFLEKLIELVSDSRIHPFIFWLVDDAIISATDDIPNEVKIRLFECLDKVSTNKIEKYLASKFLHSIGKIYYKLDKFEKCKAIFNQSVSLFGDDEKSYYYLGACYENEGDFQTSLTFYHRAFQLNSLSELYNTGIKRVSAKLNENDSYNGEKVLINTSKFEIFTRKTVEFFKSIEHQYLLAIIYLSLIFFIGFSNYKLGISHYFVKLANDFNSDDYAVGAINYEPTNPEAYNTRGLLFLRDEEYAKALEQFEKASVYRQNDFYLWTNIGYTRFRTGNFAGAEIAYLKSLELAPNYAQPHHYFGKFLLSNTRINEAFVHLSRSAKVDYKNYPELLDLARKQFPNNPIAIEQAVQTNDLKSKKILANYLIKHKLLSPNLKTFLVSEELTDKEKIEFIQFLINKQEFQTAYDVWASLTKQKGKIENKENNLINDGGFEKLIESDEVGFGWQIKTKDEILIVSLDDKIRNSGIQSMKIKYEGQSRPKNGIISQMIIVKPNQNYRLIFAYKSTDLKTGGLPILSINDFLSNKVIAQSNPINNTNEKWVEQTVDFRTNETTTLIVNLQRINCDVNNCPIIGEIWLDDISVKELGR